MDLLRVIPYFYLLLCSTFGQLLTKRGIISSKEGIGQHFNLSHQQKNPVFHLTNENVLYVGGQEILYIFDFKTTEALQIEHKSEDVNSKNGVNHITIVEELEGKILVCGTNGNNPTCWNLDNRTLEKRSDLNEGFSPHMPNANFNILITGNDAYSTVVRQTTNGNTKKPRFHKSYKSKPMLYTGDNLMRNPHFVKSLVVESKSRDQDKILLFFIEDSGLSRTTEKRLSMVAQMCKNEIGPDDTNNYNVFSTALKSRLVCGYPTKNQYFPYLQDIFMLKRKEGDLIYGLFRNAWNRTAVCSYSVLNIEQTFKNSTLFQSKTTGLNIRPGTCLESGKRTPMDTFTEVANNPEITDWVMPSRGSALNQSLVFYTNVVVDKVTAVDNETYRVLFLATDDGYVDKMLEINGKLIFVHQMSPLQQPERIRYLELDPTQCLLYMGTTREVARLPVDNCTAYYRSCESCLKAQDPYCGWANGSCQSILKHERLTIPILQNITHGDASGCPSEPIRQSVSQSVSDKRVQPEHKSTNVDNGTSRHSIGWLLWIALLTVTIM
ncbi:semaphorin-7A [Pelobates fuscus]|uniref:semaphorin-7A n=1 Tax=Pelobates fuscus TaxID=191477 RepID=UPI002FE4F882